MGPTSNAWREEEAILEEIKKGNKPGVAAEQQNHKPTDHPTTPPTNGDTHEAIPGSPPSADTFPSRPRPRTASDDRARAG